MNLNAIIKELNAYRTSNKDEIFSVAIEERLNKALVQYYHSLTKACNKLSLYSDKYELKLINKLNKGD